MIIKEASTEAQFRQHLRNNVDLIILTEPFETDIPIEVLRPVELMCANTAYIRYLTYTINQTNHSLFRVKSSGVIFNHFTLYGGYKILTDDWRQDGLQSGVRCEQGQGSVQFINGFIYDFNWGGIWAFDSDYTLVAGNRIHGAGNAYFNYGTWQGGRGNAYGQELHFTGNTVLGVRHAVGASGHPNSYWANGNIIVDTIKHAFDRHSGEIPGVGGLITSVSGNTIMNPDRYVVSINNPVSNGYVSVHGNNLTREIGKPVGELIDTPLFENYLTDDIKIYSNLYSITDMI